MLKEAQVDRSPSHSSPAALAQGQDLPFDVLTRSLSSPLPRRGVLGLLAAAVVAGGVGTAVAPVGATRRRKRHKRRSSQHGLAISTRTSTIGPNCIYVCCDGTCDSWKMCMKCVKWPKPTASTAVLTQG